LKPTRALHSFTSFQVNNYRAIIKGDNGEISISALHEGIYKVEYLLEGFKPGKLLRDYSSNFYSQNSESSRSSIPDFTIIEGDDASDYFTLNSGDDQIKIDKANGLLSVYHANKLVHGGQIGSLDTVLPRYPLRILGGEGNRTLARFNFKLTDTDRIYGLGDKTGKLNKRGQRFSMFNRDALGYKASQSDPLYKSIPFLIKHNPEEKIFTGLFFPVPRVTEIDLGRESPYYISADIKGGPFHYVVITGNNPWEIIDRFTWVTGRPSLPPLYTFGFLGSSMNYTEPDDADRLVTTYFDRIERDRIPCEGFYFSSGYVKADNGERYTFLWNKKKFPEPAKTINSYKDRGYHIACNVKPGFLTTHPL